LSLSVPVARIRSELSGIDDVAAERLATWSETLDRWSRIQRLVGWRTADLLMREGIADAWAAVPLLADTEGPVLDLGSGCGLPALILAAAQPERRFHLVEPRRKRAAFLRAAIRAMRLAEVTVLHQRSERVELDFEPVVTARGFLPPEELLVEAERFNASSCILSIAPPAPIGFGWEPVRTVRGRPAENRMHVLYRRIRHI
jgi:16S rRNA (guanine527-N7)-methyltransferase